MFVIDIETSGLSPEKCFITCVGICSDNGVKQFTRPGKDFRGDPLAAEGQLLSAFAKCSFKGDMVTYNGRTFDIPFIAARLAYHGIKTSFPDKLKHIDIMEFVMKSGGRRITRLDAIRKFSNIYVPRESSGAFLARAYSNKKITDDEHYEMLQHNTIDVCSTMRFVLKLFEYPDFTEFVEGVR